MSLVDSTFKSIPKALLDDWGQDITLVKTVTPRTYDPSTGAVTGADTSVALKGLISNVSSRESEGLYQTTDIKVIVGGDELGSYYPTEADRIQYSQAGVTREAKVLNVLSFRGEDPLLHTIIARPQ
jgi:hypothetical protein|tara:strand:+ start:708 stop:1085 length:378 start_codon:yes stop_codon:yes gene_type:complete